MTQDLNHADKKTPTGMFQFTLSYKTLISVSSFYNNVNYNVAYMNFIFYLKLLLINRVYISINN